MTYLDKRDNIKIAEDELRNLDEIINEARRTLSCPICGRKYSADEIKLRGSLDNSYVIQTACENGHPPLITIIIATAKDGQDPTFVVHNSSNKKVAITTDEVIDSHKTIENFDGDFKKLWS